MGFAFFEQDGTFNPADYGLKVGDMIAVVMIGGGGSAVNNGGESKFGDFLTASGGTAAGSKHYGGDGGWHPSLPMTLCKGLPDIYNSDLAIYSNAGGCLTSTNNVPTIIYGGGVGSRDEKTLTTLNTGVGAKSSSTDGSWQGIGGKGNSVDVYVYNGQSNNPGRAIAQSGGGGAGYGAGGGGFLCHSVATAASATSINVQIDKNGGGHGQFITDIIILKDVKSIPITVGYGGLGEVYEYTNTTYSYAKYACGDGAPGCVAVYW